MANKPYGTFYTGVTTDVARRVWEHKTDAADGVTKRYGIHTLVYVEFHEAIADAIAREKKVKRWKRLWKIALVEELNPDWCDLYETIME